VHNIPLRRHIAPKFTFSNTNCGRICFAVTPADIATIYNFNPVFTGGNTGQNQSIYLIEVSDLFSANDWTTFRSTFGPSGLTGASLNTVHPAPPSGPTNCSGDGEVGGRRHRVRQRRRGAATPNALKTQVLWR
jgi:subtilase family serine protease